MSPPLEPLPEIDLRHLRRLTDDTGLFQHALYATPDPNHGYCIDDNARALIAGLLYAQLRGHDETVIPLHTYLGFIAYAYNLETQKFRNFMDYSRRWLEDEGSHDSQGRAIWSLGLTAAHGPTLPIRQLASDLYQRALDKIDSLDGIEYDRSWAFALLGIDAYLDTYPDHGPSREAFGRFGNQLFDLLQDHATDEWPWWEELVTYDNAKLPHGLLVAGGRLDRPDMTRAGFRTLSWVLDQQRATDDRGQTHLSIVGNDGWLRRGHTRARFDQQPLEAYALVDACLFAARVSEDAVTRQHWESEARFCFDWFNGRNDVGHSLFDPDTGGSRDGLQPDGVNKNQGAESSLAYLLSVLEMHRYRAGR